MLLRITAARKCGDGVTGEQFFACMRTSEKLYVSYLYKYIGVNSRINYSYNQLVGLYQEQHVDLTLRMPVLCVYIISLYRATWWLFVCDRMHTVPLKCNVALARNFSSSKRSLHRVTSESKEHDNSIREK